MYLHFLLLQGFFLISFQNQGSTRWTLFSIFKSQFIKKASSGGPEDGIVLAASCCGGGIQFLILHLLLNKRAAYGS